MRSVSKLQFLTLLVLARRPMHAYGIRQEIIFITGRQFWPARTTIRSALQRLEAAELVQECMSSPSYWLMRRGGVPFEITKVSEKRLRREIETYREVLFRAQEWLKP